MQPLLYYLKAKDFTVDDGVHPCEVSIIRLNYASLCSSIGFFLVFTTYLGGFTIDYSVFPLVLLTFLTDTYFYTFWYD